MDVWTAFLATIKCICYLIWQAVLLACLLIVTVVIVLLAWGLVGWNLAFHYGDQLSMEPRDFRKW